LRPQVLLAGPPFLPAGMVLQPSKPRAVPHGVACRSLPSGSQALCRRLRNPRSKGAAGRAGIVASHESCPAFPSVSCSERLGSRRGHVFLCSQTLDTAVAPPAPAPARHLRPMSHRPSSQPLWQPSGPLFSSFSHSGPQLLSRSVGSRSAAARRTPRSAFRLQLPLASAMWVARSCLQMVAPLAPWIPCGGSHFRHRTSLPARSGGCRWF
jgi:hypothetical protein